MPGYRGHISFSLLLSAIFYGVVLIFSLEVGSLLELPAILGVTLSFVLFGLWPDVDTNSIGQDIFYPIFLAIAVLLLILNKPFESALVGIFSMLPTVGKHRGWTHSWWAAIIIPLFFLVVVPSLMVRDWDLHLWPYSVAGIVGYFGHLLIDGELKLSKQFNK